MVKQQESMLEIGAHQVPLKVRRNRRAKRMYLRYHPVDHSFSLTLPQRTRLQEGVDFISSKSDWIAKTLQQLPSRKVFRPNMRLPIMGRMTQLVSNPNLQAPFALKEDRLEIGPGRDSFAQRTQAALKKIIRHELSELADYKAAQLGKKINRLTLRDTKSRWGSCSSDRNVMFSWRLIFAPYEVLDYVVSHEVAHLRHMDHSPAFWRCVQSICADYADWKDWLRFHGGQLYCFSTS